MRTASAVAADPPVFKELLGFTSYSFITLTPLGDGDIPPLARWAISFPALEAVVGQIYPAVRVARLVGLHICQSADSRLPRRPRPVNDADGPSSSSTGS